MFGCVIPVSIVSIFKLERKKFTIRNRSPKWSFSGLSETLYSEIHLYIGFFDRGGKSSAFFFWGISKCYKHLGSKTSPQNSGYLHPFWRHVFEKIGKIAKNWLISNNRASPHQNKFFSPNILVGRPENDHFGYLFLIVKKIAFSNWSMERCE